MDNRALTKVLVYSVLFCVFVLFCGSAYNPTFYEQTNSRTTFSRQSRRAAELYRRHGCTPGRGFEKTQAGTRRSQRTTEKSAQPNFPRPTDRALPPDASHSSLRREVGGSLRRRKNRRFLSLVHRSGSRRRGFHLRDS